MLALLLLVLVSAMELVLVWMALLVLVLVLLLLSCVNVQGVVRRVFVHIFLLILRAFFFFARCCM